MKYNLKKERVLNLSLSLWVTECWSGDVPTVAALASDVTINRSFWSLCVNLPFLTMKPNRV